MNRKTDLFLDKYKELEAIVAVEYQLSNSESSVSYILRKPEFRSIKLELDYCREVRNLLSHMPQVNKRYAVEPTDEMIALLERVIEKIKNPKRAGDICIPLSEVCTKKMNDFVFPAILEMNEKEYTHVPIMEKDLVVGVFSENTILRCLVDEEMEPLDKAVKFSDIKKYLPIDHHKAESFRFIEYNALVSEVEELFTEALKQDDRIGLVFVTRNGKPTEKVLGIISAWDVAGVDVFE